MFNTAEEAREFEEQVLDELDAINDPRWLNLSNQGSKFYNLGGYNLSELTRKRQRKPKSAETRIKMSAAQIGNQKMKGKKHSNETRAMQSVAAIGNQNSKNSTRMRGKKHSQETRIGFSDSRRGCIFINDKISTRRISSGTPIPEGWERGRLCK